MKKTEVNTKQRGSINEGEATKGSPGAAITVTGIPPARRRQDLSSLGFKAFLANVEPAGGLLRTGNGLRSLVGPARGSHPQALRQACRGARCPQPRRRTSISHGSRRGLGPRSSHANVWCVMKMPPRARGLKACVRVSWRSTRLLTSGS